MTAPDPYVLGRSASERTRLLTQHAIWTRTIGALLPASLPALPAAARIADIGTGTGVWLRDVAAVSPATHAFVGYDISDAQFLAADELPANVALRVADFKEPWPQDVRGTFDVVNVRLIIISLGALPVWRAVLENLLTLLKPGGVLVWTEGNFLTARGYRGQEAASTPGHALTAAQTQFNARLVDRFAYSFPTPFARLLEDAGMRGVSEDVLSTDRDPGQRRAFTELGIGAVFGALANMAREGGAEVWGVEEVARRRKEAVRDMDSGAYLRWDIHVVVGFKADE
jgi:SAM-dependent methyltransferase